MLRRLIVGPMLCALILTGCRSESAEAPAEAPVAPAVEEVEPVVEARAEQVAEPEEQVEPAVAVDTEVEDNPEPTATPEPIPTEPRVVEDVEVVEEAAVADEADDLSEDGEAEELGGSDEVAGPTEAPTPTPASVRLPVIPLPTTPPPARVVSTSALVVLDDETPAPPLTVIVSMNRAFEGHRFRISGLVRNDGDGPYAGLWMNATFFRDDGSRYGPVRVNVQCPLLEPGDSCPFLLEAADKGITQVMLHPDGYPTDRRMVPVELRGVRRYQDALGYVHITGTVYNPNPVTVRDVTITGVLIDQLGEIVNVGVDLLVQPLESGASAPFEVLVRQAPYVRYELFVQALPR